MVDTWQKKGQSYAELPELNPNGLERVQKSALRIILGDGYKSYTSALKHTGTETLFNRRRKICLKFAKKSLKNDKFGKWFKPNTKTTNTRQDQLRFSEVYCRTERYQNSPISYLTKLLNHNEK